MDLSAIIALVSSHNADPNATPDHNVEVEPVQIVIGRNMPSKKEAKLVASKKGAVAAPIHDKPAVFGVTMPDRNTLDAKGFLQAMLGAGRRLNDNGVRWTDPREVRNDQIQAIHAFIGYDPYQSFGSQEVAARAKASRDLSSKPIVLGPSREEQRAASRSAAGFVAGLPIPSQRILANLKAREQAASDAMIDATSDEERAQHKGILEAIREAIAQLGF
jgi:hypothetical protein